MKDVVGPSKTGEASRVPPTPRKRGSRGISILDLLLRVVALAGTLGSALAMGTTDETLPFFNQFFNQIIQVKAKYDDLPTFAFFVIANSIVCSYLVLSLGLSIFHIVRSRAKITRVILVFFDTAMLALLTAGASAATAIVYLAHKGNASANWLAFCQQFHNFCQRISGSLIGSFGAVVLLILLIMLSAIALSRR